MTLVFLLVTIKDFMVWLLFGCHHNSHNPNRRHYAINYTIADFYGTIWLTSRKSPSIGSKNVILHPLGGRIRNTQTFMVDFEKRSSIWSKCVRIPPYSGKIRRRNHTGGHSRGLMSTGIPRSRPYTRY